MAAGFVALWQLVVANKPVGSAPPKPVGAEAEAEGAKAAMTAVGETVILLHPPLPLVGISTGINRGCQQNDSLADG